MVKTPRPKTKQSASFSRVGRGMERNILTGRARIQMSITMWKADVTAGVLVAWRLHGVGRRRTRVEVVGIDTLASYKTGEVPELV